VRGKPVGGLPGAEQLFGRNRRVAPTWHGKVWCSVVASARIEFFLAGFGGDRVRFDLVSRASLTLFMLPIIFLVSCLRLIHRSIPRLAEIAQALIAIGGKGTRIREGGIAVPVSKSFLPLCGRPLLYWNLLSLHAAGIKRLILCGNESVQLREAELLVDHLGVSFTQVELLQDPGLGVHGLPFQVARRHPGWLDESLIFECGHSLMTPTHYQEMIRLKLRGNVVFSAFRPHPLNLRQPVRLRGSRVELASAKESGCYALAHPVAIDPVYAWRLPSLNFDVRQIIGHYTSTSQLRFAFSNMPLEFDIVEELRAVLPLYEAYLRRQGLVGKLPASKAAS